MMLDWFKQSFAVENKVPIQRASSSTAISDASAIYTQKDFLRYNPDDLIGRKGYAIYKKMMRDEQVKAAVKFKRDATTSRDYFFQLDTERSGLSDEEVDQRIYISEQYIERMEGSFMDVLNYIMSAYYNGFSYTEMIFGQMEVEKKTWWTVNKYKLRPFDTVHFQTDEYGELQKVIQQVAGKEVKLDPRKFIHFVVNPDVDEFYGQSELREAYRAWFNKDTIIKFRNIWLEKHAGGFTTLRPKGNKTILSGSSEYTTLTNILKNLATSTGILLPMDMEFETHNPSNNVAFKEAIEDNDMAIARSILIPNLLGISPQGQHGSQAQAGTQFESFLWTLEADARRLEEALNEQVFRLLGKINFGDEWYPRIKFKPVSESKKFDLLRLWKEMVTAGAVQHTDTDEKHIRDLIDFPEVGEPITLPTPTTDQEKDTAPGDPQEPKDTDKISGEDDDVQGQEQQIEQTVVGMGQVSVTAFTKAQKRVDFAVIGSTSEGLIAEGTGEASSVVGSMVDELLEGIKREKMEEINPKDVKFNSKLQTKLRNTVKKSLNKGWMLGIKHASNEINKAKKSVFTANKNRLDFIEADFFDLKSFEIAGNISGAALSDIRNIILNGVKTGRSFEQVENQVYSSLISNGYMSVGDAPEYLQATLSSQLEIDRGINVNVPHRINTIVRTASFEAINEARYSFFTDPELDGFVEALEYSAILDSRTTQICQHLDGKVHSVDSAVWASYRPPNHHNCRSLLIPVTELDVWSEDEQPNQYPQRGFE